MVCYRVAVLASALLVSSNLLAQDSLSYRGPNGNGTWPQAKIRTDWAAKAPKIAWKKDLGYGFSSPVVSGTRLLTAGCPEDSDKNLLYCLNAETGAELWKKEYADAGSGPRGGVRGPVATPLISGDRVYMISTLGTLFCYQLADGKLLWEKHLNKDEAQGKVHGEFGDGVSPVLMGDLIIVQLSVSTTESAWFAFKKDGTQAWSVPIGGVVDGGDRGYSIPAACTFKGKPHAILVSGKSIDVVELASGTKSATLSVEDLSLRYGPFPEPVVFDKDKFVLGVWYSKGANSMAFQLDEKDGIKRLWKSKAIGRGGYSYVTLNGYAYGYGTEGLNCMSLEDGEQKWKWRSAEKGVQGEVILVGKTLVWTSWSGILYAGDASPDKGGPTAELKILGPCPKDVKQAKAKYHKDLCVPPVFANGRLYSRAPWGELACVDVR